MGEQDGTVHQPGPVVHTRTHTYICTYTDGTEPSVGSTHSDLMKLMESLSWSGMSWEEGFGLLSLRTVQMLSGMQTLVWSERGWKHHGMPPQRGIPESIHPHKRTRCLFGQVKNVRREGPEKPMTVMRAKCAPRSLCLPDPLGEKCFLAVHRGIDF